MTKKFSKNGKGITECDKKLLQSVTGITKRDNYYKVSRNTIRMFVLKKYLDEIVSVG